MGLSSEPGRLDPTTSSSLYTRYVMSSICEKQRVRKDTEDVLPGQHVLGDVAEQRQRDAGGAAGQPGCLGGDAARVARADDLGGQDLVLHVQRDGRCWSNSTDT
jgi:hypothetical protein